MVLHLILQLVNSESILLCKYMLLVLKLEMSTPKQDNWLKWVNFKQWARYIIKCQLHGRLDVVKYINMALERAFVKRFH